MSVDRARSSGAILRMRRSSGVSGARLGAGERAISPIVSSRLGGKKSGTAPCLARPVACEGRSGEGSSSHARDQNRVPPPNWNH